MDDDNTTSKRPKTTKRTIDTNKKKKKKKKQRSKENNAEKKSEGEEKECGDVEVWDSLSRSFKQVQSVLDKNRELIRTANENHQSKIPDNIAGNVSLIRQINGNISKVVKIYSDMSVNFSDMVRRHRRTSTPPPPPPPTTDTSADS